MILRKPYAFLIKNFKLIHAVMALCLFYLVYKSSVLMNFLNEYVSNQTNYIGTEITDNLFNIWMFILPLLLIVASLIVMVLMLNKRKPYKFYIINILSSIFVVAYYSYAIGVIGQLELKIVDIRLMRVIRDIIVAVYVGQLLSFIITLVRATGFNIKQFDFGKDLKEMEISEADREEFEVNFEFNIDKTKRKINRAFRFFKYNYLEHRLIINSVVVLVVVVCSLYIFIDKNIYNKTYLVTSYFNTREFNMRIEDAYVTRTDALGNVLVEDGKSLVVLRFKIKTKTLEEAVLDIAKTELNLGDYRYYPIYTYRDQLLDIGIPYQGQTINNEYSYYTLTYEVLTSQLNEKVEFNYIEALSITSSGINPNTIHVALNLQDLEKQEDAKIYEVNEEITFEDSIFKNSSLKILDVAINEKFTNTYNKCISNECFDFIEYVKPNISGNYDKTLLKVTWNISTDEGINTNSLKDFYSLMSNHGLIEYTLGNQTKIQKTGFGEVVPVYTKKTNVTYLEVLKEMEQASNVTLTFTIRNRVYKIKIK